LLIAWRIGDDVSSRALGHRAALARWRAGQVTVMRKVPSQALELAGVESSGGVLTLATVVTAIIPHITLVVEGAMVVAAIASGLVAHQLVTTGSWGFAQLTAERQRSLVHTTQIVTLVVVEVSVSARAVLGTRILPRVARVVLLSLVVTHRLSSRLVGIIVVALSSVSRNHENISLSAVCPSASRVSLGVVEGGFVGGTLVEAVVLRGDHDPACACAGA